MLPGVCTWKDALRPEENEKCLQHTSGLYFLYSPSPHKSDYEIKITVMVIGHSANILKSYDVDMGGRFLSLISVAHKNLNQSHHLICLSLRIMCYF